MALSDPVEISKKTAAFRAVDENIKDGDNIGIGSGSTIVYAVQRIADLVNQNGFRIKCVPTSFQSRQLLLTNDIAVSDLDCTPNLDWCVDGADEVDSELNLIKGGGGCLMQEKVIASCAHRLLIVADSRKKSTFLSETWKGGIPLEVLPMAHIPLKNRIEKHMGGLASLRMAKCKAGPVVTDNGNFILDWRVELKGADLCKLDRQLHAMPGLLETGFFLKMASVVYIGNADGSTAVLAS